MSLHRRQTCKIRRGERAGGGMARACWSHLSQIWVGSFLSFVSFRPAMTTLSSTLSTSWRQPDYDALIKTTEEVYNEVDKVSFTFKDVFRRHEQHFRCQLEEPTQRLVKNHVFDLLQAVHQNFYADKAVSHPEEIYNYTPNEEYRQQPKLHDLLWSTDSLFVMPTSPL